MYCVECGAELANGANFCPKCGAAVKKRSSSARTESAINPVKRRSVGTATRDFVSSKVSGTEVKTVTISLEDMIQLLTEHFIRVAVTDSDRKRLHRALRGTPLGRYSRRMHSADEKYYLYVRASFVPGFQLLQLRLCNYMFIEEEESGRTYQYEALSWGKFRRAVDAAAAANWT